MNSKVAVFDQSPAELTRAAERTAMASPTQLKQWLIASGRRYIIFDSDDLVDALPWPGGVEALTQVVECYRQHRCVDIAEEGPCPSCNGALSGDCMACNGVGIERRYKSDVLELDEMKAVVAYLVERIRKTDPNWSP